MIRGRRISLWLVRGEGGEAFKNIPIISSQEASLSENILYHASCEAAGYMTISLVHKIECGFARLGPEMHVVTG